MNSQCAHIRFANTTELRRNIGFWGLSQDIRMNGHS